MWIAFSLGAMGLLAVMLVLIVLPSRAGVPASVLLFYVFAIGALFNLVYIKVQGSSLRLSTGSAMWIVLIALLSFLGNLSYYKAIQLAPNPGYPAAIEGSKMVLVTLLAAWLLAAELTAMKGIGALFCAIGVVLLCL